MTKEKKAVLLGSGRSQDFKIAFEDATNTIPEDRYVGGTLLSTWARDQECRRNWERKGMDDWRDMTEEEREEDRKYWRELMEKS